MSSRVTSHDMPFSDRLAMLGALSGIGIAVLALAGWGLGAPGLCAWIPGTVTMNPLTGLALIVAGASIVLLAGVPARPWMRDAGRLLAGIVIAITTAKLCDVLLHTQFDLDLALFGPSSHAISALKPMAPNTAIALALLGIALLALAWDPVLPIEVSQAITLAPAGMGLLAILGYALDVSALYGVHGYSAMALNTAVALTALSGGILFATPRRGLVAVFAADDAGGELARKFVPYALVVPAVLAWLRPFAQRVLHVSLEPSVSFMVFASIMALVAVVVLHAHRISAVDRMRIDAANRLEEANATLEQRVLERTSALEAARATLEREVEQHIGTAHALSESEVRYRALFFGNPQPMWVVDRESQAFLSVNDAAVELYGYAVDEFLRMTVQDIRPTDDLAGLRDTLPGTAPDAGGTREWRHVRKDGRIVHVEVTTRPLVIAGRHAVLALVHDVSGRKQLEDQFRQAQKLDAIGHLAGAVAHDFNNLLMVILGQSELLRSRFEPAACVEELDEIQAATERAAALTRQLLAFSRQQAQRPRVLDINTVVANVSRMLRRLIGDRIELSTYISAQLWPVMIDPGQVEQVLLNLVVNARDAMPQGGRILVETANVVLDPGRAAAANLEPGPHVMLAVSDTGTGMDAATRSRAFEPFFTTKAPGHGTGLGLSTVHGIVQQSGGHIEISSEPGRGTTVTIYLPRVSGGVDAAPDCLHAPAPAGGSETILVVEDDEQVRRVVARTLVRNGYTVIEAADRSQALDLCGVCAQSGIEIEAMLSDLVVPGHGAEELHERLRAAYPRMKVLYMSGYSNRGAGPLELDESAAFLAKPFSEDDLLEAIRGVLGAAGVIAPPG